MKNIQAAIGLIGAGLTLGFTLVIYAHANFSTQDYVKRVEENTKESLNSHINAQKDKEQLIINQLNRIESKIDRIVK